MARPGPSLLDGTWKATFADSPLSGTVYLTLDVRSGGIVQGKYQATTGGAGIVEGRLDGQQFSFKLSQAGGDCPGFYKGTMTLGQEQEQGVGAYVGSTCLGEHRNGVVSMVRATDEEVAALESPEIVPAGSIYNHGRQYWVSKSQQYLMLLSAEQTKGYFVLHIAIQNDSSKFVTFDPERMVVEDLHKRERLRYYSPEEVAKKIRRRGTWMTVLRALAAGMQSFGQSQPTTSYNYGTFDAYDQYGNFAYGTYSGTTTSYSAPDTSEIQRQSAEDIAAIRQSTDASVAEIERASAHAHTMAPKSYLLGRVYFSKAKKKSLKELLDIDKKDLLVFVYVPLGGETFKFGFPIKAFE